MPWVKLTDDFYDHRKFLALPDAPFALWVKALAWSNRNATDGHVLLQTVSRLGYRKRDAEALASAGLWNVVDDGWCFHDFHDYQPTAEEVREQRRVRNEAKVAAGRKGGLRSGEQRRSRTEAEGQAEPKQNRSRTEANGTAEPQQKRSPGPGPVPPALTSLSSLTGVAANGSEDEKIQAALDTITRRDYEANADQVKNRAAWTKTALENNRRAFAEDLAHLAGEHPDWAAEQLADAVAPSPHEAFYDGVVREL